jgi:hypothetical protein
MVWNRDTSPFSIPWPNHSGETQLSNQEEEIKLTDPLIHFAS